MLTQVTCIVRVSNFGDIYYKGIINFEPEEGEGSYVGVLSDVFLWSINLTGNEVLTESSLRHPASPTIDFYFPGCNLVSV